jgi:hypothetical protein
MSFWNWLTRRRDDHGWPNYIINGRIRTSTVGLIVAFFVVAWVHNTYQPAPVTPSAPETAVVPPGFVPDPEYTWVPRTNVQERPTTRTTTPTTTTTTTEPTETSPTETTSSTPTTSTSPVQPTTVVDPDGPGPLSPQTLAPSTTGLAPTTISAPGAAAGEAPSTPEQTR